MPLYEFICQDCGKPTEVRASVADYSKGLGARCPYCGSGRLARTFSGIGLTRGTETVGGDRATCGPGAGSGCCGGPRRW